jgi:hypothetical protein
VGQVTTCFLFGTLDRSAYSLRRHGPGSCPMTRGDLQFQRAIMAGCLFVFISTRSTMRFSRYGLGASYLATHNHPAIPEVTDCMVRSEL